jgi:lipoprotein NlpD
MRLAVAAALVSIAACSSTLVDYESRTHVVRPGETLYTIAWRHGVDYKTLAAWNGIPNPDLIFVGQRLQLRAPARAATTPAATTAVSRSTPRPVPPPPVLPAPRWQWPTRGEIVSRFGAAGSISSGIGIGGSAGQPIVAAAPGRVVYAGSGLIGYGQLVILEHNATYLTAYGHNERLLVEQGQSVERGQQIAEMGLGPERKPRLHFEVRRNGVPVDPLQLLD